MISVRISCGFCSCSLAELGENDTNIAEFAEREGLTSMTFKNKDVERKCYVCSTCERMLLENPNGKLKKVTKKAFRSGNSSAVIVPREWDGSLITAYKIRTPEE